MKKILIVDDEIAYIKLYSDALSKNYHVVTAENGKKGVELVHKHQPDLILLDISMPVMDGLTALKEIRKDQYGKTALIVMLTNLEPTETIIKDAALYEPAAYVIKSDISLAELQEKIKKLLP